MDTIIIIALAAMVIALALGGRRSSEPEVIYIPVEVPARNESGCLPVFVLLFVLLLVALALAG